MATAWSASPAPLMMPVTLLLRPQRVKQDKERFERGRNLTAVMAATAISALVLPPLADIALNNVSLWILPLL